MVPFPGASRTESVKHLKVSAAGGLKTLKRGTETLEAKGAEQPLMDPQEESSISTQPVNGRWCNWTLMGE